MTDTCNLKGPFPNVRDSILPTMDFYGMYILECTKGGTHGGIALNRPLSFELARDLSPEQGGTPLNRVSR